MGKQIYFSVLAVVQQTENEEVRLVHKRRFQLGTPYSEVIAYTDKASQALTFDGGYVDKTGMGENNFAYKARTSSLLPKLTNSNTNISIIAQHKSAYI